jgi:DNA-directed RNA polymerase subunit L
LEVKVVKQTDQLMEIEIVGEEHTLTNLLVGLLAKDSHVKNAFYNAPHPLIDSIVMTIITDGQEKPMDALLNAIDEAVNLTEQFEKEFKSPKEGQ